MNTSLVTGLTMSNGDRGIVGSVGTGTISPSGVIAPAILNGGLLVSALGTIVADDVVPPSTAP